MHVREQAKRWTHLGWVGAGALALLSVGAAGAGLWKLLGIAWTAFAAMVAGAVLGVRYEARATPHRLVWGYGLASGAMIASAAVFLVPPAIGHHAGFGGVGLGVGVIAGFAIHAAGHQLTHARAVPTAPVVTELTAHALADGVIIGLVYAAMPALGPLVGLAIVSHKGPAGYAAASRLKHRARLQEPAAARRLLLPASATGVAALPVGLLALPGAPVFNALVFGFAAGVFLHVAMDFLPRCEVGGEISEVAGLEETDHALLDRLRRHAALSTTLGGALVFAAWLALGGAA